LLQKREQLITSLAKGQGLFFFYECFLFEPAVCSILANCIYAFETPCVCVVGMPRSFFIYGDLYEEFFCGASEAAPLDCSIKHGVAVSNRSAPGMALH